MQDRAQKERSADATSPPDVAVEKAPGTHSTAAIQSLRQAMRRARYEDAEHTGVIAELRAARLGRLEMLHEALQPLTAQLPREVDLFDVGLMPGVNPRLFIDMIGFVEMGRDARVYRFVQDTRYGRIEIAESEHIDVMVEAVTDYVARRLLERDKALAADTTRPDAGRPPPARPSVAPANHRDAAPPAARRRPAGPVRRAVNWGGISFAFLIDLLGSIAFFLILAGVAWVIWNRLQGQTG